MRQQLASSAPSNVRARALLALQRGRSRGRSLFRRRDEAAPSSAMLRRVRGKPAPLGNAHGHWVPKPSVWELPERAGAVAELPRSEWAQLLSSHAPCSDSVGSPYTTSGARTLD